MIKVESDLACLYFSINSLSHVGLDYDALTALALFRGLVQFSCCLYSNFSRNLRSTRPTCVRVQIRPLASTDLGRGHLDVLSVLSPSPNPGPQSYLQQVRLFLLHIFTLAPLTFAPTITSFTP